jgi:hypothetical protein
MSLATFKISPSPWTKLPQLSISHKHVEGSEEEIFSSFPTPAQDSCCRFPLQCVNSEALESHCGQHDKTNFLTCPEAVNVSRRHSKTECEERMDNITAPTTRVDSNNAQMSSPEHYPPSVAGICLRSCLMLLQINLHSLPFFRLLDFNHGIWVKCKCFTSP